MPASVQVTFIVRSSTEANRHLVELAVTTGAATIPQLQQVLAEAGMTNSVETPPQIELIGVSSADNDDDNIGAAVVGAVLGSVCGLLLIGIAFFFVSRTRGNTPDLLPHPVLRIGSRINRDRPPSQPPSKGQSAKSSGFKEFKGETCNLTQATGTYASVL